jgi:hypothetical protein
VFLLLAAAAALAAASLLVDLRPALEWRDVQLAAAALAAVAVGAAIFPRLLGYPALCLAGAAVVLVAWLFLYRVPGPVSPLAEVRALSDGRLEIRFSGGGPSAAYRPLPAAGAWSFELRSVSLDRAWPWLGGRSLAYGRSIQALASEAGTAVLPGGAMAGTPLGDGRPEPPAWLTARPWPGIQWKVAACEIPGEGLSPGRRLFIESDAGSPVRRLVP